MNKSSVVGSPLQGSHQYHGAGYSGDISPSVLRSFDEYNDNSSLGDPEKRRLVETWILLELCNRGSLQVMLAPTALQTPEQDQDQQLSCGKSKGSKGALQCCRKAYHIQAQSCFGL